MRILCALSFVYPIPPTRAPSMACENRLDMHSRRGFEPILYIRSDCRAVQLLSVMKSTAENNNACCLRQSMHKRATSAIIDAIELNRLCACTEFWNLKIRCQDYPTYYWEICAYSQMCCCVNTQTHKTPACGFN